jgi:hypothetical protein
MVWNINLFFGFEFFRMGVWDLRVRNIDFGLKEFFPGNLFVGPNKHCVGLWVFIRLLRFLY